MSDNPTAVLIDVSGSQVGTQTNPFHVTGSLAAPSITINNVVNLSGADENAPYVVITSTGSLPNAVIHETLRQLIHLSNDDGPRGDQWPGTLICDRDSSPFPSGSIWWLSSARTHKVAQSIITRNSLRLPVTIQWLAYETDGVSVAESYTDTITYSGVFEVSRTRSQP